MSRFEQERNVATVHIIVAPGNPDYLAFSTGGKVRVYEGQNIHVGCHSLTREAWEMLKREVDGK